MRREEHRRAPVSDPCHQSPNRAALLRVEPGGELVEEHGLGFVDESEGDEEPLLLAAREVHEPGVALGFESKPREQRVTIYHAGVERPPEVHRLPHLDPLLEVCLLVLHPDSLPESVGIAPWVEAEHRDCSFVGNAIALYALHRGRLTGAVRTYQSKDLALEHFERDVVNGDGAAVALAQVEDGDDGDHDECYQRR